jgi:hypothetical protein
VNRKTLVKHIINNHVDSNVNKKQKEKSVSFELILYSNLSKSFEYNTIKKDKNLNFRQFKKHIIKVKNIVAVANVE